MATANACHLLSLHEKLLHVEAFPQFGPAATAALTRR
jgi:hypothetical protein